MKKGRAMDGGQSQDSGRRGLLFSEWLVQGASLSLRPPRSGSFKNSDNRQITQRIGIHAY